MQNAKLLQSEELEKGNCQSLVNGTSGPYYAMECHSPYYVHSCLSKWCSLIALCFNETWNALCYKKFKRFYEKSKWFYGWSNFDISTVTKDVTVSNVRNIYIKICSRKTFRLKATEYRCASKTAQKGTYAEIKHCMCYEVIRVIRTLPEMNLTNFRVYSQTCVQRSPLGNGKVTVIYRVTAIYRAVI